MDGEALPEDELQREELLRIASFGEYVTEFWNSDLGQYLLNYTLQEYNLALEEFKSCDPTNIAKVTRIQSRMWRAESFKEWLSRAIAQGAKALDIVTGNEDANP